MPKIVPNFRGAGKIKPKKGGADIGAIIGKGHDVSECALSADPTKTCSGKSEESAIRQLIKDQTGKSTNSTGAKLVNEAKAATGCDKESCLYGQQYLGAYIDAAEAANRLFKPLGPAKTEDWLNNDNIDQVGSQLSDRNPDYVHIPFKMNDELDALIRYDYQPGKCYGCVINTDVSTGPGEHWTCLFVDYRDEATPTVEFFDSLGKTPLPEVLRATAQIQNRLINASYNEVASRCLQQDNHSCGVWSLSYIWARMSRIPPSWFSARKSSDSDMQKLRGYLFRD